MRLFSFLSEKLGIPWFRLDSWWRERARTQLVRQLVEDPDSVPSWIWRLLPEPRRRYLKGLQRIDATPFARPAVDGVRGRVLRIDGRDVVDFANGGYLGLDFDLDESDIEAARASGLRNGWSRASGTLPLTRALEGELAEALGFQACRLATSIGLINQSIFHGLRNLFPVVLMDEDAHVTMKRGVRAAYGQGRAVRTFANNDLAALTRLLEGLPQDLPKLVVIDGVYSMKGTRAPLQAILALCKQHHAVAYVDDAHGFGVLGETGCGTVEELDADDRRHVILVAGFAKCCSNPVAFVAFPERLWYGIDAADFLTFCGPPSNLHAAAALRHLRAFTSSDLMRRRAHVEDASAALHAHCAALGIEVASEPRTPILAVRFPDQNMEEVVDLLDRAGLFAKIAVFPVARPGDEAVRFCLTALHTPAQLLLLERALETIAPLCRRTSPIPLRKEMRHVA